MEACLYAGLHRHRGPGEAAVSFFWRLLRDFRTALRMEREM